MNDNSNPQQGTQSLSRATKTTTANIHTTNNRTSNQSHSYGRVGTSSFQPRKLSSYLSTVKDDRKLFVGGLGPTLTHDQFKTYFESYGKVIDSVVMIHPETKRSRGFGFVTFESSQVAQTVLASGNVDQQGIALPPPPGGWTSGKVFILEKECEVKASIPKKGGGGSGGGGRKDKWMEQPTVTSESSTQSFEDISNKEMIPSPMTGTEVPGMAATGMAGTNPMPPPMRYPVAGVPPPGGWVPNLVPVVPYPMDYPYGGYYPPQAEPYYDGYAYGGGVYGYNGPVVYAGPVGYGYPPPMEQGSYGYEEQAGASGNGEKDQEDGENVV